MSQRRTLGHTPKVRTRHCKLQTFSCVILEFESGGVIWTPLLGRTLAGCLGRPKEPLSMSWKSVDRPLAAQSFSAVLKAQRAQTELSLNEFRACRILWALPHAAFNVYGNTKYQKCWSIFSAIGLHATRSMRHIPCQVEWDRTALWAPPADCQSHSLQNQLQNSPNLDSWLKVELW